METGLNEIDRARAVLSYGAQMADPRRNDAYWKAWNEFEISHGNEETFREMLRIKRSVEASFSTVNYNAAEMSGSDPKATETLSSEDAMKMIAEREGVEIKRGGASSTLSGFVKSSSNNSNNGKRSAEAASLEDMEERVAKLRKATANAAENKEDADGDGDEIDIDELVDELEGDADADEIDIDDEEEEETDDEGKETNKANNEKIRDVSTKVVPAAVFGGLVKNA